MPHKRNRAVLFHSSHFHQTDTFKFKPGYTNRRINFTLLFGFLQANICLLLTLTLDLTLFGFLQAATCKKPPPPGARTSGRLL